MGIILSDSVIREMGTGKLSFIGSFHQYQSGPFPFMVPPFVVTALLTNFRGKLEKPVIVTLRIEDPKTGIVLANVATNINAPPEFVFSGTEVLDVPFPIHPIAFQAPGVYSVIILIDGEKIESRPLPVNSMTALPQPPKPPQ